MAKVITTDAQAFTAFTQATQHAQSRANAAEAERAATEAARLALPTQVAAVTGPAVAAAQAAASLSQQRAGVLGGAANDAALVGRAAGDYRVGTEIVSWNGSAITARTGVLASEADVQGVQALAAQADTKADSASNRVQASVAGLDTLALTDGRVVTELGTFDLIPAAGQTTNGGTVRSIGVPGVVARLAGGSDPHSIAAELFGARGDGTNGTANPDRLTAALAEAMTNTSRAVVQLSAGVYALSSGIVATGERDVTLRGAGKGATKLILTADAAALLTATVSGTVTLENLTLMASGDLANAYAVICNGGATLPGLVMRDVEIGQAEPGSQFAGGVNMRNVNRAMFDNVIARGRDAGRFIAYDIQASGASVAHKWLGCDVYNARRGVQATTSTNPGIEGLQFVGCDLVDVYEGIYIDNTSGYFPPQLSWTGGHINARHTAIYANRITQISVSNTLMYMLPQAGGGHAGILIPEGNKVQINNLQIYGIDSAATDGVVLGTVQDAQVSNLHAKFSTAGGTALYIGAGASGVQYDNISREGGALTVQDEGASSYAGRNIHPMPASHITVSAAFDGAGHLDLSRVQADFVQITNASGTLKTITPRRDGQRVTLQCDTAGVKIEHNAALLLDVALSGVYEFTFRAGERISLYRTPGAWRQV